MLQGHSSLQLLTSEVPSLIPDLAVTHRSHSSLQRTPEDSSNCNHPLPAGSFHHGGKDWSGMDYSPLSGKKTKRGRS